MHGRLNRFALTLVAFRIPLSRIGRSRLPRKPGPSSGGARSERLPPCGHRATRSKASARPSGPAVPLHLASHSVRNSLDQHLVNFVLPEFQGQPGATHLPMVSQTLGQPLLESLGSDPFPAKRMQSFHSLVCQILPLRVVLDAIQQDASIPLSRRHVPLRRISRSCRPSTAIPPGSQRGTTRTGEKGPYIIGIRRG